MKASDFRKWLEEISQFGRGQKELIRHCLSEVVPLVAEGIVQNQMKG